MHHVRIRMLLDLCNPLTVHLGKLNLQFLPAYHQITMALLQPIFDDAFGLNKTVHQNVLHSYHHQVLGILRVEHLECISQQILAHHQRLIWLATYIISKHQQIGILVRQFAYQSPHPRLLL